MQSGGLDWLSPGEKLIILLDYSGGLLKRGENFDRIPEKIIEQLSQRKQDPTANISKVLSKKKNSTAAHPKKKIKK